MKCRRSVVLLCAAAALVAVGSTAAAKDDRSSCTATAADLQSLRDNLEIVRTQTSSAKDNFGPGGIKAFDAAGVAIAAFQQALGRALAPSPDSLIVRTPGRTHHPRMNVALQAMYAARRALDRASCLIPGPVDAVRSALADAEKGILWALDYNAPSSGG